MTVSSQIANSRSMRDFTHVLETEVLATLSQQEEAYGEIQRSARQLFEELNDTKGALTRAEDSSETRCRDSVNEHDRKIKQLEEDIASMILQMRE